MRREYGFLGDESPRNDRILNRYNSSNKKIGSLPGNPVISVNRQMRMIDCRSKCELQNGDDMLITHSQLRSINEVQIQILKAVSDVCKQLDIAFFMVHGSLLGTVKNHGFIPDDDDIDIAIKRDQYNRFLKEAPALLDKAYFVQDQNSDPNYPMEFAKVRASSTTYIVESAKNIAMNHGIYIDVFPIDYAPDSQLRSNYLALKQRLMNIRIAEVFVTNDCSKKKKAITLASKLLYPDLKKTVVRRNNLYQKTGPGAYLKMTGGKKSELKIPKDWFQKAVPEVFEGVDVFIPDGYDAYLKRIYGDYQNRTLIENKYSDEEMIEVNACVVDTETAYTHYV